MTTLSDARFDALRGQGFTGATSDLILQWLQANGATSNAIPDAWREVLTGLGYDPYHRNDSWYAYLGDQGYTGSLNDRELQFFIDGGVIGGGYDFNGTNQYATHAAWSPLGSATAYPPQFQFATDNPDGNVLNPTPPITEFGRNGANYHVGSLVNLRYVDTSPLNGANYYKCDTGVTISIPEIALRQATIRFDFIYTAGDQVLLTGSVDILSVATNALVAGANVSEVRLDGGAPATLVNGQHYKVEVDVDGGTLTTVSGTCGFGNLQIEVR